MRLTDWVALDSQRPGTSIEARGRAVRGSRAYDRQSMAHDSRVDAYFATLPADEQEALQRLRAQIARQVPDAVETISYGMPAFKLHGRGLVWFAAWKAHCSVYPLTDAFLKAHTDELKGYRRTKGSLHFTPQAPLPEALVEDLVRERIADIEGTSETSPDCRRPR